LSCTIGDVPPAPDYVDPPGSLGWWINDRRIELDMGWEALADQVGVSRQALHSIRKTGRLRDLTKRRLEGGLKWKPGSIDAIKAGGEPTPIVVAPPARYPPEIYERVIRTDTEARIMAVRKQTEQVRWGVIFGLREEEYDDEQSARGAQLRKDA